MTFLHQLVLHIKKNNNPETCVVVMPSRRAGIFFKRIWMQEHQNQTVWMPQIWTIEEFMQQVSSCTILDNTTLLFEMYKAYSQSNTKPEDFDGFMKWANTTLNDLNDIDRNIIEVAKFFKYIQSIERMDHWEPQDLSYDTPLIQQNIWFWEGIEKMYFQLVKQFETQKSGHQGWVFRKAYESCNEWLQQNENHFIFAGFNALTKAEEEIIKNMLYAQKAEVFFDADPYYLENPIQEAGTFLRTIKKWKYFENQDFNIIENHITKQKNIQIIGTPKQSGQVKLAGSIIEKWATENTDLTQTALILADENLLEPALNALPKSIDKVNVTMGYPLKNVPLGTLFGTLLNCYVNWFKFNQKGFYHEDLLHLLNHHYWDYLIADKPQIISDFIKQNRVFIAYQHLPKTDDNFLQELFPKGENPEPQLVVKVALEIIQKLSQHPDIKENSLEMEYLFHFSNVWNSVQKLLSQYPFIQEIKTLQNLYNQILQTQQLSFYGEPLQGLQLMGMLETRLLDFKKLIITSVNEGILPKGKTENSFIPFDVRKNQGLPTFQENDAIFAYHFYRLLQRAEDIYLIYNTENDEYGAGEKSRFLSQIEIELPQKPLHSIASEQAFDQVPQALEIAKTPDLMNRLQEMASRGFSPSALNAYIRNPLVFYYNYVLRLDEVEEVEETIDFRTLGKAIHATLEELYKPWLNKPLTSENLKEALENFEPILHTQFQLIYTNGDYSKGENLLIFNVAKRFIHNFLQYELKEIQEGNQIVVKKLETELKAEVPTMQEIRIKGIADRIDTYNGQIRVIDYKTGLADPKKLSINSFEEITESKDYEKAMQLMLYIMMYQQQFGQESVGAGIVSFRKMQNGVMMLQYDKNSAINQEITHEFLPYLQGLIAEILNPNIPFVEKVE